MRRPLRAMAALFAPVVLIAGIPPMAHADPPKRGRVRRRVQTGRGTVSVALAIALSHILIGALLLAGVRRVVRLGSGPAHGASDEGV